jgi:hypothetical protein
LLQLLLLALSYPIEGHEIDIPAISSPLDLFHGWERWGRELRREISRAGELEHMAMIGYRRSREVKNKDGSITMGTKAS